MRIIISLLGLLIFTFCANAAFADVHVDGYYRKDGTYVQPHYRSDPDGNPNNNWSTQGNTNPHTGQEGTKPQQPYYGSGNGQYQTQPQPYNSSPVNPYGN